MEDGCEDTPALTLMLLLCGRGRFTVMNSPDGIIYALITGATFGWLWPH